MTKQPLGEVFGFPIGNDSADANRYRTLKLCPYHNIVPNCTKDKASDPLGVCSIIDSNDLIITCPIRFREDWIIAEDAAGFFFPTGMSWTSLTEVRLKDEAGGSAGNIDVVLVAYDDRGRVIDFGALEVQAVYISGNVRNPFDFFMGSPSQNATFDWGSEKSYPRADFLSSSRKRLAPQLIYKGGILHDWNKKTAVALDRCFFETLPRFEEVDPSEAEMAWLVYDLILDPTSNRYRLTRHKAVYTKFVESLRKITEAKAGKMADFVRVLQTKLDTKLIAPNNNTIGGFQ